MVREEAATGYFLDALRTVPGARPPRARALERHGPPAAGRP